MNGPYWLGLVVGLGAAALAIVFGFLGIALAVVVVVVVLMLAPQMAVDSAGGLITGVGLPLITVAIINRNGPGESCTRSPSAVHCSQLLDPVPLLVAGTILVAIGLVIRFGRVRPSQRRGQTRAT